MNHIPRKRFGQNFLTDQDVIRNIVEAIRPQASDNMVEIGPGLGALTRPLLAVLAKLQVVEIDRDIVSRLENQYSADRLAIHSVDALKFDFSTLGESLRIVGNLPYNISTPLLFHLAEFRNVRDMHFMLQKEVVERMVAEPSTSDYGRLSVMLQCRFYMEKCLDVGPEAFNPAPKVDSAVVRMIPLDSPVVPDSELPRFAKIVQQAFSQRRKTLRNTLKGIVSDEQFAALGIDSMARAENLSVEQFASLARVLA